MTYPSWLQRIQSILESVRRSLLTRLPHPYVAKGDRFVTVTALPVRGLVQWHAPLTSDFECVIPENTVLVADHGSAPHSTGFGCVPINRAEMESQLVPEQDRCAAKYAGYYFVLPYAYIGKQLQRVC